MSNIYRKLERQFPAKPDESYKSLVNFSTNYEHPIHRWYYYKEGYSPELVLKLLDIFKVQQNEIVMDPFCGCGTTLLAAFETSKFAYGFEVNPFSYFGAFVKTRRYSSDKIKKIIKHKDKIKLLDMKPKISPPGLSFISKVFNSEILRDLLMFKEYISEINDNVIKDFLFFGWLSVIEEVSNVRKDGNGIKYRSPDKINALNIERKGLVRTKLLERFNMMTEDMIEFNKRDIIAREPEIFNKDASLMMNFIEPRTIKAVIFSPPYANCFDYCEVYKIELWMGDFIKSYSDLKFLRSEAIRSHVNIKHPEKLSNKYRPDLTILEREFINKIDPDNLWNKNIPNMIKGYFEDMGIILKNIYEVMKRKGICAIVVGNSAYGNVVIPTDQILSLISSQIGFKFKEIKIARRLRTSSQQMSRIKEYRNLLRESIVILEK